jgi:hypothetical protein
MNPLWLVLALWSADCKTTTTGTAVGVNYSVEDQGLLHTSAFEISESDFSYSRTPLLGFPIFRMNINKGHLFVHGQDLGVIKAGDQLAVSPENTVRVNGLVIVR